MPLEFNSSIYSIPKTQNNVLKALMYRSPELFEAALVLKSSNHQSLFTYCRAVIIVHWISSCLSKTKYMIQKILKGIMTFFSFGHKNTWIEGQDQNYLHVVENLQQNSSSGGVV